MNQEKTWLMYRIVVDYEGAKIEEQRQDKAEAYAQYFEQCRHNAESCAMAGGRCEIYLWEGTRILKKLSISSYEA